MIREYIRELIQGKMVLLLGFGREGKSTYRLLKQIGTYGQLAIADRADVVLPDEDDSVVLLTGPDYQSYLDEYDVVFKSPGIVLEREFDSYRCGIVSQTEVFFQCFRDQIIGITGTKGKSTTTSLLYHVLKEVGMDTMIAGNIGIPAFDCVDSMSKDTKLVFELSSHQLEYMTVSPYIGVLMNIHEEHLDHYGTMEKYVDAKKHIFYNQTPDDIFICNEQCLPGVEECRSKLVVVRDEAAPAAHGRCDGREFSDEVLLTGNMIRFREFSYEIPEGEIRLLGHHNFFDIGIVYAVCKIQGIADREFDRALRSFEPLPHRLHFIGEKDGVKYYDDSISTICDTTIQALKTLKDADTVLIGGMDRGIDYGELIEFLSGHTVPNIILMEATGKRIYQEILKYYPGFVRRERLALVGNLADAVRKAKDVTRTGHSCVLSPAAASYGIFKNFEERGDVFVRMVME